MIFATEKAVLRRSKIMPEQATLAKAVFDNKAESPRELDFRKGDCLLVLDQKPNGFQGWWRCRIEGREGLAPANRLRLLTVSTATADYDIPKPFLSEKTRHSHGATSPPISYLPDSPPSVRSYRSSGSNFTGSIVFRSPPSTSGSSSGSSRLSIATSDLGSSERNSAEPAGELYDVLPGVAKKVFNRSPVPEKLNQPAARSTVTSPVEMIHQSTKDGDYDYIDADAVNPAESHYDHLPHRTAIPRKTLSKDANRKRESFLRCVRLYDVLPKQAARAVKSGENLLVKQSTDAVLPKSPETPAQAADQRALPIYEPLNITKHAALTRISSMQSQVQTELARLFSFVSDQTWRDHLQPASLGKVRLCCSYLVTHLKTLIRFLLRAALASARNASDSSLEANCRRLIDAVYVSCKTIRGHLAGLDKRYWAPDAGTVLAIESIVATGQVLTEDVRKMTAFVLGNAQLIFAENEELLLLQLQERPLPYRPESATGNDLEDDDDDHEYEDVDYGHVKAPALPRSPRTERKILNSYIQEVNEEVGMIRSLTTSFVSKMFTEKTVTSLAAIEKGEAIVTRTSKLSRLTESLSCSLTFPETMQLRTKLKKIGGYITTASKRFNSAVRAASATPDDAHFKSVKSSLDYLIELCQFLKDSTETEV